MLLEEECSGVRGLDTSTIACSNITMLIPGRHDAPDDFPRRLKCPFFCKGRLDLCAAWTVPIKAIQASCRPWTSECRDRTLMDCPTWGGRGTLTWDHCCRKALPHEQEKHEALKLRRIMWKWKQNKGIWQQHVKRKMCLGDLAGWCDVI